jgi:hypothetical protein
MINVIYESQLIKTQIICFIFSSFFLIFFLSFFFPFFFLSFSFPLPSLPCVLLSYSLDTHSLSPDDNCGRASGTSGAAGDGGLHGLHRPAVGPRRRALHRPAIVPHGRLRLRRRSGRRGHSSSWRKVTSRCQDAYRMSFIRHR